MGWKTHPVAEGAFFPAQERDDPSRPLRGPAVLIRSVRDESKTLPAHGAQLEALLRGAGALRPAGHPLPALAGGGGAGGGHRALRLVRPQQPGPAEEDPAVYRQHHRQRGHRQQVHPHQLAPAHHGLPAGYRRGHLEQRGLSAAGRRPGAPLRDEGGGRRAPFSHQLAAGGEEPLPGAGGDERPPLPGLRQPAAGQGPQRPGVGRHHLLGGRDGERQPPGEVLRHPARHGPHPGGQLRRPHESLPGYPAQRHPGPDRREAGPVGGGRGRPHQDPAGPLPLPL